MKRRARSALLGIFLMASQILQGGLAASVPCDDDSLGVLVPSATDERLTTTSPDVTPAHAASLPTSHAKQHCKFCPQGACYMTHVPALAVVLVPLPWVQPRTPDVPAPAVESFDFRFDLILRPPK